jgi:hypothetical protein
MAGFAHKVSAKLYIMVKITLWADFMVRSRGANTCVIFLGLDSTL